jgi:hypothetical protein
MVDLLVVRWPLDGSVGRSGFGLGKIIKPNITNWDQFVLVLQT